MPVHNYQTDFIVYSQIQTVFDPEYVWCENLEGYDYSLSITSAQGNMAARMMARKVLVMVLARRMMSYNIIMIIITSKWINYLNEASQIFKVKITQLLNGLIIK